VHEAPRAGKVSEHHDTTDGDAPFGGKQAQPDTTRALDAAGWVAAPHRCTCCVV
jgi:hypothetical protein